MKNTEAEAACSDAREGVSRCKHSNYGGCVQHINYQRAICIYYTKLLARSCEDGDKPRPHGGCVQRINYQHVVVFFSVAVFIHVLLP